MKEPTEAQIKEFWERCGLKQTPRYEAWYDPNLPEGEPCGVFSKTDISTIDLNNLFKYAVPKLLGYSLFSQGNKHVASAIPRKPVKDLDFGLCQDGETPALALFWAIWEVIHNEG